MSTISKRVKKILADRLKAKDREYNLGILEIEKDTREKFTAITDEAQVKYAKVRYDRDHAEKALEDKLVAEILGTI